MGSFTEQELLEIVNDMGYDLSSDELKFFKEELDRLLDELEKEDETHRPLLDSDISFNSLANNVGDLSHADLLHMSRGEDDHFHGTGHCFSPSRSNYESKNVGNIQSRPSNIGKRFDRYEITDILDKGFRCLQKITEDNSFIQALNDRFERDLERVRKWSSSSDGNVEQAFEVPHARNDTEHADLMNESDGSESDRTLVAVDPAVRPVLRAVPGRTLFRHDPVKKYEIYNKGWAKNPPPGEKKRLSLRWKVREYMLRQDIATFRPSNLVRRRISNPDWSPRPYLD
ncbi:unnamed protein product [Thelazia callipaeda]|uniref:HYLS1_C domain-containing protein n=1 Tax=Thelazia callipaeda TaxID=103827 RepID=A0A0N5D5T1_THECL|nr:unnamed protein product [Thelazia callipaeda]